MKNLVYVLFALAITVNIMTLKDGHNWGDDFAQYIINAHNIIEGKPFMSGVMLDKIVVYPPGFPLLLAPVLKVFGLNFKVLKLLNIFFWYLSIVFLYVLFLRIRGRQFANMAAVFLAFSSFFFVYKQNVLSDIPFFLFICLSLYAIERWENGSLRQRGLFFAGFLFSMSAALWLRSVGVTLFAAAMLYFIFVKPDKRVMLAVLTVFLINELVLFFWMGGDSGGFLASMGQNPHLFMDSVINNFATVFRSLWYFFCPYQTIFSQCLSNKIDPFIALAAPLFYLIMIWSFIRGFQKKNISYLECFSFFYISAMILWSGNPSPPSAFARFIFPLLPFVFIASQRLPQALVRVVFLVLLLINISNMAVSWNFNDDVINLPVNSQLVDWVKRNMKPNEHFMFWKPRALALLTEREGTAPWIFPQQERYFIQRVKDFDISYIFSFKDNNPQGFTAQLEHSNQFRMVWENAGYKVFRSELRQ